MRSSLFQFCLGSIFCPSLSGTTVVRVPAPYIRDILCSVSTQELKIVPLLNTLQLPMLSVGTLTYSEPNCFSQPYFIRESQ